MEQPTLEQLQYPIGKFVCPETITKQHLDSWIHRLETLPERLSELLIEVTPKQLKTAYRPGGWSVQEVIHHIADSHHHSYTRFKWALTEDNPLIKAYDENSWNALSETSHAPVAISLAYIKALHVKLVYTLRSCSMNDFQRTFVHPEGNTVVQLAWNVGNYAWHGDHHLAHIELALAQHK